MPEYIWIYDNRQGSEYESYNTQRKVPLEVNEYLLRDRQIQEPVKDLGWAFLKSNYSF